MEKIISINIQKDDLKDCSPDRYVEEGQNEFKCFIDSLVSKSVIDGSKVSEKAFSLKNVDVFISYSSKDQEIAKRLARSLQRFLKLTVFLDCDEWLYSDDILKAVDNKYCQGKGGLNYNAVRASSAHFNAMLSVALFEQIANSRILLLLNTKNSIPFVEDTVKKTCSPWIYEEIVFASRLINLRRKLNEGHFADSALTFTYDLPLSNIPSLDMASLRKIFDGCKNEPSKAIEALLNVR